MKNLCRLSLTTEIKPFDCGDADLNEFLFEDSRAFLKGLLAVTYLLESDTETVAFFSLFNDKIAIEECASNRKFGSLFRNKMPEGKRFTSFPAVKIGRLGVSNNYKGKGIGTDVLNYIKHMFIDNNRTGCKYITVDAYNQSVDFYKKNGFLEFPLKEDKSNHTKLMYYDLSQLQM